MAQFISLLTFHIVCLRNGAWHFVASSFQWWMKEECDVSIWIKCIQQCFCVNTKRAKHMVGWLCAMCAKLQSQHGQKCTHDKFRHSLRYIIWNMAQTKALNYLKIENWFIHLMLRWDRVCVWLVVANVYWHFWYQSPSTLLQYIIFAYLHLVQQFHLFIGKYF